VPPAKGVSGTAKEDESWEANFEAGNQNPQGPNRRSVHFLGARLRALAMRKGFVKGSSLRSHGIDYVVRKHDL
jgi:hypothetical protein